MKEKIKKNKIIILVIVLILVVTGIWWYQHQKNQEINDYCIKVFLKGGHKYLSLDECIDMVKKAGGRERLKEILIEMGEYKEE